MPDIGRELSERRSANLDIRVGVRVDTGGTRNQYGEFVPGFEDFTVWARRADADTRQAYEVGLDGFRETGTIRIVCRYDARIAPGAQNIITVGGEDYVITLVEEVGRKRYMIVTGKASS